MKRYLLAIFFVTFVASGCNYKTNSPTLVPVYEPDYAHQLQIGSQTLNVEIADTAAKQKLGLSYRKFIDQDKGMLFDFEKEQQTAFWMKDMNFNLDFIWINKNKIIGITPDVPAPVKYNLSDEALAKSEGLRIKDSGLLLYSPPSPVNWVLEVNAGWTKKNNISVGDDVKLLQ